MLDQYYVYEGHAVVKGVKYVAHLTFKRDEKYNDVLHCDSISLLNVSVVVFGSNGRELRDVCLLTDGYWSNNVSYGIRVKTTDGTKTILLCADLVKLKFLQGFFKAGYELYKKDVFSFGWGLVYGENYNFGVLSESIPKEASDLTEGVDRSRVIMKMYPYQECAALSSLAVEVTLVLGVKGVLFIDHLKMYYDEQCHKEIINWRVGSGECRYFEPMIHNVSPKNTEKTVMDRLYRSWSNVEGVSSLNALFVQCDRKQGQCVRLHVTGVQPMSAGCARGSMLLSLLYSEYYKARAGYMLLMYSPIGSEVVGDGGTIIGTGAEDIKIREAGACVNSNIFGFEGSSWESAAIGSNAVEGQEIQTDGPIGNLAAVNVAKQGR